MAEATAGLELPIGLTEQKFLQQLARIEARALKSANGMQQGFVRSNKAVADSFGKMSGAARGQLQNVSYQLQDIFVQISSGTAASRALGQQLPQLLSGFGAMGAVLGLAASAAIPLAASLFGAGDAAESVSKKIEALEDAIKSYSDAAASAATPTAELAAKYGEATGAARELYTQLSFLAQLDAMKSLQGGLAAVTAQFGGVRDVIGMINAELSLGLGDSGLVAGGIQTLRDEYGLTVDQARQLVDLMTQLETAQGINAQADAASNLSRFLADVVRQGGDIPPAMIDGARATAQAGLAALDLRNATQEAADAAATVAGQAGSIDFSGAIAGANSLAAALARASSAAAALSSRGAFVGSDGSIQTNRTGQRDPSTNWRFEDPNKDYETIGERRALEAARKAQQDAANAKLLAGGGAAGGARKGKSGKGGSGSKREEPGIFESIERDATALQRQIELLGKSNEEVATAKARWELLDAAKKRGLPVNDTLTAQIDAQAANVGRLTAELERAELTQDQFEDAIDGIAGAMSNALIEGESLREGLAQVFKGIAVDILNSGIRNALTDAFSPKGGGGGWLGSLIGGLGGGKGIPGFDGGGFTGMGSRSGGIDGKGGFPAILHPRETVIDHTRGQRNGGSTSMVIDLRGTTGDAVLDAKMRAAGQQILAQARSQAPGWVSEHQKREL